MKGHGDEKWTAQVLNLDTAATVTWIENRQVRAAAVLISGVDDKADWEAASACEQSVSPFVAMQQFAGLRGDVPRPALISLSSDQATFTNRIVNTLTIGLALALFEKLGVKAQHLPLGSSPPKKGEAIFTALAYRSDGALESRHLLTLSSFDPDPRYRQMLNFFAERFNQSGEQFSAGVGVGLEKVGVVWQTFGGTAGVATITRPGQANEEAILLMLTGLDYSADEAAIAASEKFVAARGMSDSWSRAFRAITTEGRALLVRFLTGSTPSDPTGERVSWCLAAAFFRHKRVL